MTTAAPPSFGERPSDEAKALWVAVSELIHDTPHLLPAIEKEDRQLYDTVVAGLQTLAIEARWDEWRSPEEGIGGRPEQLIPGTPGSTSDRQDWLTWLLMGGRGCVAAGTEVLTVDGPVPIERFGGGWVLSWDRGQFRPALASPSYRKGRAPLFRVATARGDVVTVTAQHRFLTPRGWVPLDRIERSDVIWSHPGLSAPSGSPAGALSWPGTPAGCSAGCRPPCRCGGPPPRRRPAAAPAPLPSPAGAPARSRLSWPTGGPGSGTARSRPCRPFDPRSRTDSGPAGPSPAGARSRGGPSIVEPTRRRGRTAPRSRPPTGPGPAAPAAPGLWVPADLAASPRPGSAPRSSEGTSPPWGPSTTALAPPPPSTAPIGTEWQLGEACPDIASSDDKRWTTIASVEPVGEGDFWDITVPGPANYVAGGLVHHNSGKSRTGAEAIREMALWDGWTTPPRGALVGQTLDAVRIDMVENTLLQVLPPGSVRKWNRVPCELWLSNGAYMKGYSSESPRKLRGPNFNFAWADELATWADADISPNTDSTYSNLKLATRAHANHTWVPRIVATTTPRPVRILRNPDPNDPTNPGPGVADDPLTVVTSMTTLHNLDNLASHYIETVVKPLEGTRLYDQEILGELIDERLGALWSFELVERMRCLPTYPELQGGGLRRVVIGCDPSIGAGMGDECGIVAIGLGMDGIAYVLEDASIRGPAEKWVEALARCYWRWDADCIVVETNQGGELVEQTIGRYAPSLPLVTVHAKRGKLLRAEPVALLSDQGRLRLAGKFMELERQMRTWNPEEDDGSPDRVDALVYAALWLLPPRAGLHSLVRLARRYHRR